MAGDDTLHCTDCGRAVTPHEALDTRCACGDSVFDHAEPDMAGCRACSCALFEWDGSLACPACLGVLDESAPRPGRERRAA